MVSHHERFGARGWQRKPVEGADRKETQERDACFWSKEGRLVLRIHCRGKTTEGLVAEGGFVERPDICSRTLLNIQRRESGRGPVFWSRLTLGSLRTDTYCLSLI